MPHSMLVYRSVPAATDPPRATIVALHGYLGNQDSLVPLARAMGDDVHIVAPAAARCVYQFRDVIGQTWFGGQRLDHPEASSFGDSLAQVERFLHDVIERNGPDRPNPFLLGVGQGAVLALSLAAVTPELMSGVMAIGGCLPSFSDPALLQPVATHQPVLLIGDPDGAALPPAALGETNARLTEFGRDVTTITLTSARRLDTTVSDALSTWLANQLNLLPVGEEA